jgi:hypothetical protein
MGNYITFEQPNTETSWSYTLIERSIEQSASYSQLTSQLITNNTFFDESGTSSHWYRLRFFDAGNVIYSSYTDPFQATNEYYCTPRQVASFMGRPQFSDSTNPTRYEVEDIISGVCDNIDTITRHAWRKKRISNEYHDVRIQDRYQGYGAYPYDYSTRIALLLKHRNVRTFTSGTHKIEVWDGTSWVDFIATYTEGRAQDYWINYERGIIYFVNRYPLRQRSNVRVTYDFGESIVPGDICNAAILLTAAFIIGGKEDLNVVYPQNTMGSVLDTRDRWEKWTEKAQKMLDKHTNIIGTRYF